MKRTSTTGLIGAALESPSLQTNTSRHRLANCCQQLSSFAKMRAKKWKPRSLVSNRTANYQERRPMSSRYWTLGQPRSCSLGHRRNRPAKATIPCYMAASQDRTINDILQKSMQLSQSPSSRNPEQTSRPKRTARNDSSLRILCRRCHYVQTNLI